jgi:hypothetical protein
LRSCPCNRSPAWNNFRSTSIQGIIAVIIVGSVAIVALWQGGEQGLAPLKDLALVVVGFYFGTRRSEVEAEAIAAGVAKGAAVPPTPSTSIVAPVTPPVPDD